MKRVRLLQPAKDEVRAAAGWYESKRSGLGVDFLAVLDEALSMIAEAPLASPLWKPDHQYRRKQLRRFPYTVFYRIVRDVVIVVAVAHQRRTPGYWTGR